MDHSLKSYTDELKILIQKSHDSFEKQLNYISAGALGISMLFVEKIVKDITLTKYNWLLVFSWVFFTLTLISNLVSHIYTSNTHDRTLSEIYSEKYDYLKAFKRNQKIKYWNTISIGLLFAGIIFQIIFISTNINMSKDREIKPAPKPDETRGYPASQPPKPNTGQPSTAPPPNQPSMPKPKQ